MNFDNKAKKIIESYRPIRTVSRLFYPRNFNLSLEFKNAFRKEYARLKGLGLKDKHILHKINKALPFHKEEQPEDTNTFQY